jgi:UDP-GlcNAc:undecaprenyl-phosphate GlcNAc-1-phosphate transferase
LKLTKATMVGAVATILMIVWVYRFEGYSRSVFIIDWLLLLLFVSGSRVSFRALAELLRSPQLDSKRVLIYGAGDGGELALREMLNNAALHRTPVGFLDDDRSKQRTQIRGYPVIGGVEGLSEAIVLHRITEIVIASDKILAERLAMLDLVCEQLNVPVVRASVRWEPANTR